MKHEILWYSENGFIKDNKGRTRIFRGFNFGGIKSPTPAPNGEAGTVSFTDRPFPESEADEYFRRLADVGHLRQGRIPPHRGKGRQGAYHPPGRNGFGSP